MRRGSLAEERPELLAQWARSNPISPSEVSCGSHKKVLWVCKNGHTWEATVKNRALIGSGCPYCEHRAVLKGYNDLLTAFPDIAKTWSPKNLKKPSEVSSKSNADVLWICENGHEWRARIADRTDGHGCPYCAGQRVWKGFNDLATTHPHLAAEWSDKNKFTPESITYKNRSNVWWHCGNCGCDYQAVVYARERYAFIEGDNMRGQNQMRLIKAIIKKLTSSSTFLILNYKTILADLEGFIVTNLDSDEIDALVKMQLNDLADWNVKSYAVTGDGGYDTTYSMPGQNLYVTYPDSSSVKRAQTLINKVYRGETLTDADVEP